MIGKIYTLGDVATYINGRAFKPAEWETTGLPIVRIQNLTDRTAPCNRSTNKFEDKFLLKDGDLLFAWAASLGVHIWQGGPAWLNQHIFKVIPNEGIEKKYLYFYLLYTISDLYRKAHGSGMVHITKGPFLATKIPLPSLAEQQRIVAKIEELFSELDNSVAALKQTKAQLSVYRQAVLKDAFSRYSCSITNLGNLIEKPRYGSAKKCTYVSNSNSIPVYRIPNINHSLGRISHTDLKYTSFDDTERNRLKLNEHDLLMIRSNGSVSLIGRSALVTKADINGLYAGYLIRLRLRVPSLLLSKYILHYLNSPDARRYIESKAKSTSGVHNINSDEICRLPFPICDECSMALINQELEAKLSVCTKVETTIDKTLRQAESLRQSILKQAFEGKLV